MTNTFNNIESYPGGEEVESGEIMHNLEKNFSEESSKNLLDHLKTKTGEGSISEYLNHPLNFNQSPALARILRGVTGFFGETDFALADILIGLLEFFQKKPEEKEADII